uniref:LPD7 domain-containing protein n=1 Tax=Marinobacterium profundum TaxID=1714300 RepID=UPI00083595F1|nr:LPD7 domain-containing protein [Marinobacterium profundum]
MAQKQITDRSTYLVIPFDDKDNAVKAAGKLPDGSNAITFDGDNKLWYAKPGADLSKVSQWLPDQTKANSTTAENDPQIEFTRTLEGAGFIIDGLPEMDGRRHRVKTQDDKSGQKTGVYVGYLDGVPAGWYQDHRTHSEPVKWKATGQKLDQEAQTHLRALALQRKMERQAKQERSYDHNARRVGQAYELMPDATDNQGYLERKGVKAFPGAKMDKRGRLVLPLRNENDEIRTLQRIDATGFKSLKKNGQKSGNYFVVGDRDIQNGEPVLYAEGYSTSASIAEATGRPVVMTVDAGNLPRVAEKLKEKYPDSPHFILGDDDRDKIVNGKEVNKGREKAEEAAELTNGVFRVPEFNEQEQQAGLTDFNDLHQSRGLESVREQVEQIVAQSEKVESMSEGKNENTNEPVITENFEQYVNQGLGQQQESQIDTKQAPAIEEPVNAAEAQHVEAIADQERPSTEQAEQIQDSASHQAEHQTEAEVENTIEPHIEQKQETSADVDARAWLTSNRRQSVTEILETKDDKEESLETARREQFEQLNNQAPTGQAGQQADPFVEQTSFKPVVPERVAKNYVEIDGKYYFGNRPDSLAFVDKGARLQTKLSNAKVAGSMVDIAEARGWTEIQVKGTADFRRDAWLEASARGLAVQGYKPKEEDLARLKKLTEERQSNEIEAREQADQPRSNQGQPSRPRQQAEAPKPREAASQGEKAQQGAAQTEETSQANDKAAEKVNRLAGTVVEHGKAPYEDNPENRDSYYVTLENSDGEKSTTWGVDLERAMAEREVKEGDKVELENLGRQPVTVNRPVKDDKGKVVGTEQINSHRNKWDVKAEALQDRERDAKELVREHPDLVNEVAAIKVAEKFSQQQFSNAADRDRFMDKVRTQLSSNVSRGEQAPEVKLREEKVIEKEKESER